MPMLRMLTLRGWHAVSMSTQRHCDINRLLGAVTNMDRAKAVAGSAAGLLLGHVIGQAFKPTAKERALFGKAAGEIRGAADKFVSDHLRGAKLAAAEAFGFTAYGTALLAVLAAASDYFGRGEDGRNPLAALAFSDREPLHQELESSALFCVAGASDAGNFVD